MHTKTTHHLTLTRFAYDMLERQKRPGATFIHTGTPLPDGTIRVPVDAEVHARIRTIRQRGESDSDVILRVIALQAGLN